MVSPRFVNHGATGSVGHAAPRYCPVCGEQLLLTRLGCMSCGTELSGSFEACEFCALSPEDREVLRIFLASRGNMKDLERHLGVSYPTARARFDALLGRLGLAPTGSAPSAEDPGRGGADRLDVLRRLARGEIDLVAAEATLEGRATSPGDPPPEPEAPIEPGPPTDPGPPDTGHHPEAET
ncbi:MAG: DUF2089 domain-containing protein [Acidimicrobiales bacterium]|nr:DUF2089 domain-containing protein [Acidimicrobiales bacterium]